MNIPIQTLYYDSDFLTPEAMAHYGLQGAVLTLMNSSNNTVYRVDAAGERYVLRLYRPGRKRLEWIQSELIWLTAINHDTDLRVPQPAGDVYTEIVKEMPVHCALFHWRTGETVTMARMTPAQAYAVGRFAGKLHTTTFTPPFGFQRPRLDWEGLFGTNSPYQPDREGDALITSSHRAVIDRVTAKVKKVMDSLDMMPQEFGLIHADLIDKNLLFDGDEIVVLDFDDCAYGYYLYDLAPFLLFASGEHNYAELRSALWEGYTSVRPLPERHQSYLDVLIAARQVASIRWVAGHRLLRANAPAIIDTRVNWLRHFLQNERDKDV